MSWWNRYHFFSRLQLQGEVALKEKSVARRDMRRTLMGIVKEEGGIVMLWRGIAPALLRHTFYTGIRMTAYDNIRAWLEKENKARKKGDLKLTFGLNLFGVCRMVFLCGRKWWLDR